ncbi:MAG: DEP domain-containing protein [Prochloraceae cyanobacterium]|nr:DEP domain-containing protein [Prochloraceae cyanobacterium]
MLILTTEDVKFCFVKPINLHSLMGMKYGNWYFYFNDFLNLDLEEIKIKYQQWLDNTEKSGEIRAILKTKAGFYLCVHLSELKPIAASKAIVDICQAMRNSADLEVNSRRQKLRIYKKCFVGSEAVNWMVENLNISRSEAVKFGRKCLEKNLFAHVLGENDFEDNETQLYRFQEDGQPDRKYQSFVLSS